MSYSPETPDNRSEIDRLGKHHPDAIRLRLADWVHFANAYRPWLVSMVRNRLRNLGPRAELEAEDFVEGFFVEQIAKQHAGSVTVFTGWNRSTTFRPYLWSACWNSVKDQLTSASAPHNRPHPSSARTNLPSDQLDAAAADALPNELENREWVNDRALKLFTRYLVDYNGTVYAKLFRERVLKPYADGRPELPAYEEFFAACDCATPRQAALRWSTVIQQLDRTHRQILQAQYAAMPPAKAADIIEDEIVEFRRLLVAQASQGDQLTSREEQRALQRYVSEAFDQPDVSTSTSGEPDLSRCSLSLIAQALTEQPPQRTADERREEWNQLLATRLANLVSAADCPRPDWSDRRFGDLLHLPHPPLELLRQAKESLKARSKSLDGDVDKAVWIAAYLACIARVLAEFGDRNVTEKTTEQLSGNFTWLQSEAWIDPPTCDCVRQAQHRLLEPGGLDAF